jgi:hypothetical protein
VVAVGNRTDCRVHDRLKPHDTDFDHVTGTRPARGRHQVTVEDQGANLGQRNGERLDHVAERRRPVIGCPHLPTPMTGREEQPQLRRETDSHLWLAHSLSMPAIHHGAVLGYYRQ